jgi:hypothetical protein
LSAAEEVLDEITGALTGNICDEHSVIDRLSAAINALIVGAIGSGAIWAAKKLLGRNK